jgi:putative membrane protein
MDRRSFVLAAAASTILAGPAVSQSAGPSPQPAAASGTAEARHLKDTMRVGSLALVTSRLALQKADDKLVKRFAQFEVAEQETIAEVIKAMEGANLQTGAGVAPNAEAEAQLDDKGKSIYEKLKSAKSGSDFDNQYVQAQRDGHQELLRIQQAYLGSGKSREEIGVAKLASGQIKEHLTLLNDLGGSKRS